MASCRAATSTAAVALILLAVIGLGEATVLFHNMGTTPSGWDSINQEHEGTVTQVANIFYGSRGTAIKCTQTYDSSYTGRYHSEVGKNNVYSEGDTGFYGFAFRLQSDWEFDNQIYNIAHVYVLTFDQYEDRFTLRVHTTSRG